MGKNYRPDRMAGEIQKIVSSMLVNGIKDPRLVANMVNITGAKVTNDGSYAYIYFTVLDFGKKQADMTEEEKAAKEAEKAAQIEEVMAGLNSAKGMMKKEIAKAVKVRRIPELIFKEDTAASYGQHIDEILATLPFEDYHAVDPNEVVDEDDF